MRFLPVAAYYIAVIFNPRFDRDQYEPAVFRVRRR